MRTRIRAALRLPGVVEFPSQIDLVAAAKRAAGVETDDQLARYLGQRYGVQVGQSAVWRWATGDTKEGPRYNTAIVLMHIAGWLNEDRIQAVEAVRKALEIAEEEQAALSDDLVPEPQGPEIPRSETG